MKTLTLNDIDWEWDYCPSDVPLHGNVMASGDDSVDHAAEDEIRQRLEHGDEWAWFNVRLTGRWNGLEANDFLGACSYESETDWLEDAYATDMQGEVLHKLQHMAETIADAMRDA